MQNVFLRMWREVRALRPLPLGRVQCLWQRGQDGECFSSRVVCSVPVSFVLKVMFTRQKEKDVTGDTLRHV